MKRPQKVTPITRPNQYARKLYGKKKLLEEEEWTPKKKDHRAFKKRMNRKVRHLKNSETPENGGTYKK